MSDKRKIVKCKGCGADIFFEQGVPWYAKKVPVLVMVENQIGGVTVEPRMAEMKTTGYVSHFINCPEATQFSQGKGKP